MSVKTLMFVGVLAMVSVGAYATGENVLTSKGYVDTEVGKKQNDIGRKTNTNTVVTYPTTAGGTTGERTISTELGNDTNLVTRGAINTALNQKQGKITGTNGNVATYNAGGLDTTGKAIYNASGTYSDAQKAALIEAGNVNDGIVNGFNAHLTCANPPDCTLWNVNSLTKNTAYVPTSANSNN